MKSVTKY